MSTRLTSRPRKLSPLQRTFVKLLLRTDNLEEAKKNAQRLSQIVDWTAVEGIPNHIQEILDCYGLTLEYLLENYLVPMLDATKTLVFSSRGEVRSSCLVQDLALQLKAVQLALTLWGAFDESAAGFCKQSEPMLSELKPTVH